MNFKLIVEFASYEDLANYVNATTNTTTVSTGQDEFNFEQTPDAVTVQQHTAEDVASLVKALPESFTPEPVSAPEEPTIQHVPAGSVELDSEGIAWDAEWHAKNKSKNNDGTWRKRRRREGDPAPTTPEPQPVVFAPNADPNTASVTSEPAVTAQPAAPDAGEIPAALLRTPAEPVPDAEPVMLQTVDTSPAPELPVYDGKALISMMGALMSQDLSPEELAMPENQGRTKKLSTDDVAAMSTQVQIGNITDLYNNPDAVTAMTAILRQRNLIT